MIRWVKSCPMVTRIYALTDPETGRIRYIGKTVKTLAQRLKNHMVQRKHENPTHKNNWLNSLHHRGLSPGIVLLEECDGDGADEERFHVRLAKMDGLQLTNSTVGGEGVCQHSEATRRLLAILSKRPRKPHTDETRRRISLAHTGKKRNPEHVDRSRATLCLRLRFPGWNPLIHAPALIALRVGKGMTRNAVARHIGVSGPLVKAIEDRKIFVSRTVGPLLESLFGPLESWPAISPGAQIPKLPTYNQRTDLDRSKVVELYTSGNSFDSVAKAVGGSRRSVLTILRSAGIPIRSRKKTITTCQQCGSPYHLRPERPSPFCSRVCYSASRWVDLICGECGKPFKARAYIVDRNRQQHCSRLCKVASRVRLKTYCPHGHPLDGRRSNGLRYCRTCNRDALRRRAAARLRLALA